MSHIHFNSPDGTEYAPAKLPKTVHYETHTSTAVLFVDNPPLNALDVNVLAALYDGLARAQADDGILAVILFGEGQTFCVGADIQQPNLSTKAARHMLREVITLIESSPIPVVAAIHGSALGGGLELALGCHYRIALAGARLGLPEVNLGLVPSGGGTQRLPRVMHAADALEMILSGVPIGTSRAHVAGLLDEVVHNDLLGHALQFATRCTSVSQHPVASRRPIQGVINVAQARAGVDTKARNAVAQRAAIDCVETATRLPLSAGLDEERRHYEGLLTQGTPAALRHLYFAEKTAARVGGSGRPDVITRIGIVGAGSTGASLTMEFADAGYDVILYERDPITLERGMKFIRKRYVVTAAHSKQEAAELQVRLARIAPCTRLKDLADVDLVIEAEIDCMAVKHSLFQQLDKVCKPQAILATRTSWLNIDDIAATTRRPHAVIGMHLSTPDNATTLLEVVRGQATSADTIATCMTVAQKIDRIPVLVRTCEGFIGNRMLAAYRREALFLLEEGASVVQIDEAMTQFGMAVGPFAMADLAGLETNREKLKRSGCSRPPSLRYSDLPRRLHELGRFGQIAGRGYYRYEAGSRKPLHDPAVDTLIRQCAHEAGIVRRAITREEIISRCVLALVNEGAYIVGDGTAQRASDVDVVCVRGYGFPGERGGPMFHAQTMGLQTTLDRLRILHRHHGDHWTPAPLLERLVASGATTF